MATFRNPLLAVKHSLQNPVDVDGTTTIVKKPVDNQGTATRAEAAAMFQRMAAGTK